MIGDGGLDTSFNRCSPSNSAQYHEQSRGFASREPLLSASPVHVAMSSLARGCSSSGPRAAIYPSLLARIRPATEKSRSFPRRSGRSLSPDARLESAAAAVVFCAISRLTAEPTLHD